MNKHQERILVVGPAWVGDMVMAQSLFMTLQQRQPVVIIDVLAPAWSLPLLSRMPQVNDAIALPVGHGQLALVTRFRLGRQLQHKGYTKAIVIPRSFKAALVPFFAGIPLRTGYRGEMRYGVINDMRVLNKEVLTQTVQRQVALGLPKTVELPPAIPYPQLDIDGDNQRLLLKKLGLHPDKPVIGLMPGAEYGPAKQWPIAYYQELAGKLIAAGYLVWVFGSDKERAIGEQVGLAGKNVINLCGKTRLEDVVDLIALCDSVVSNDSGLMHVACATGRRVIAIYGSSSPSYTPPLS
ncbi:MAG: lipopolysaccharide heptosyltransferase II, partial [Gammaproteobacteria bacterium]